MKVTLLALYTEGMQLWQEEIGLCSLASFLRRAGYEVQLISYLESDIDYKEILDFKPDLLGISLYDINKNAAYRVSGKLRQLMPELFLCFGGNLPTYFDEGILEECKDVDFVIRGEGENVLLEVVSKSDLKASMREIKGVTFREGEQIIVNESQELICDLDSLPFPARDLLIQNHSKSAQISTSRGCKAKCTFCASQLFWKRWRGRSVKNIVDELEYIVNTYGIRTFNFIDGSFEDPGDDSDRLWQIAREIVDRKLFISYFCHMRAEFYKNASDEQLRLLKESGLCGVCTGLESGNKRDLRLYGKIANHYDMDRAIHIFNEYGINIEPGFINFNPYSTLEGLRENINFLKSTGLPQYRAYFYYIQNV